MLEYAEAVTDELSARLLEQLGPAALVELTACIAFADLSTRSNTALGITSQGCADACDIPLAARPGDSVQMSGSMIDDSFVAHPSLLFTVAYEMLGSADAEDALLLGLT